MPVPLFAIRQIPSNCRMKFSASSGFLFLSPNSGQAIRGSTLIVDVSFPLFRDPTPALPNESESWVKPSIIVSRWASRTRFKTFSMVPARSLSLGGALTPVGGSPLAPCCPAFARDWKGSALIPKSSWRSGGGV